MINRRDFIKSATLAGGMMYLPSWVSGKQVAPNSRLNVALVGVGGIGAYAVGKLLPNKNCKIVALCDVDDARAASQYKRFPASTPKFRDFRVMFDKMGKQIDAVVISTPDHMHYPIAAWAIANGKHVFCQKPLTRTIWEANELKRLAKEAGVITQMGNQGHTHEGWRLIKEWYEAGILGQIKEIHIWTNRPVWPQGELTMPAGQPVPSTLDYNAWLGVAPYQPYNKDVHPFKWRGLRNYGTGAAGDMACHFLDVPYSAFELGCPYTIVGNSTPFNDYSWPSQASSVMTFLNKRGVDGRIKLHWYDGGRKPKEIERVEKSYLDDPRNNNATFIVGTKETVYTNEYGQGTRIWPASRMKELAKSGALPKKTIERSNYVNDPFGEWVDGCIKGVNPPANFDYAAPFTEMALLGMVALCVPNTELKYVPSKMSFLNCPEADKYIHSLYEYRSEFLPSRIRL